MFVIFLSFFACLICVTRVSKSERNAHGEMVPQWSRNFGIMAGMWGGCVARTVSAIHSLTVLHSNPDPQPAQLPYSDLARFMFGNNLLSRNRGPTNGCSDCAHGILNGKPTTVCWLSSGSRASPMQP